MMDRRTLLSLLPAALLTPAIPARAEELLPVYNLAGTFMNWNLISEAYAKRTGVRPTLGLRSGSGPALVAMRLEASRPQASAAYWSLDIAVEAKAQGVTMPYQPKNIEIVPASLKDAEGHWWAVGSTNVVMGVNEQVLAQKGLAKPGSYADLLRPEYRGLVACMDPTWSGTASVFMYGINFVLGGTQTDFRPGMRWLQGYVQNGNQFRSELVAPRLAVGDAAITLDAEGGILQSQMTGAPVSMVIPREGVVGVPVGMSLAKGGPKQQEAKAFLDWLLGDEAQRMIAEAYFRPVRTDATPAALAKVMPNITKVAVLDIAHQAKVLPNLKRAFTEIVVRGGNVKEVLGKFGLAG